MILIWYPSGIMKFRKREQDPKKIFSHFQQMTIMIFQKMLRWTQNMLEGPLQVVSSFLIMICLILLLVAMLVLFAFLPIKAQQMMVLFADLKKRVCTNYSSTVQIMKIALSKVWWLLNISPVTSQWLVSVLTA